MSHTKTALWEISLAALTAVEQRGMNAMPNHGIFKRLLLRVTSEKENTINELNAMGLR